MNAAIDIGTNTVLLLVAELKSGGIFVKEDKQRIPRLGQGVDQNKMIGDDAAERVISALKEYKDFLQNHYPDAEVILTATSAVRDAGNRESFLRRIKDETGYEVRLLSGPEEAEWTAAGAISALQKENILKSLVIDIGGGSTEVIRMKKNMVIDSHSYDMGSVRFTERYLQHDPPTQNEIEACRNAVKEQFKMRPFELTKRHTGIGVAGTCTSVICMLNDLQKFDARKVNAKVFTRTQLGKLITCLTSMSSQSIEDSFPQILKGRADIILAGLLILEGFMQHFRLNELKVSTGGIRHGALMLSAKLRK